MGLGPGHQQRRVVLPTRTQAGAERGRRASQHCVGIGKDDLAHHAVCLELSIAASRIPSPPESLLVLVVPVLHELELFHLGVHWGAERGALHQVFVEGVPVPGFEVLLVLGVGETRMGVGRDDQVVLGHHGFTSPPAKASEWESAGTRSSGTFTSSTRGPTRAATAASCFEIEAVDAGGIASEHRPHLIGVDPGKGVAQGLGGVGVRSLDVRVVLAPHDLVDADVVAEGCLVGTEEAGPDEAVVLPVEARRLGDLLDQLGTEMRLCVSVVGEAAVLVVEHAERGRYPTR